MRKEGRRRNYSQHVALVESPPPLQNPFVFPLYVLSIVACCFPQQAACLEAWRATWHQLLGRKYSAISAAQAEFVFWCYFQFREHFLVFKMTAFLKSHAHQKIVLFLRSQQILLLDMVNCQLSRCWFAFFCLLMSTTFETVWTGTALRTK